MPDYESTMRRLAKLCQANPYHRVYEWRQILDKIWREGFDAGYTAGRRDAEISEQMTQQEEEARTALPEEKTNA
ncbi:hypothetical protein [Nonomuraea sp. NPDC001023]|uniref:hypothetical protein n=1 Tax=unclassified Nonomuraea TaxID=2593643 RepID=UPI00331A68A6